ncbi:MAG: pitrilysin family protein [bacterium]|nr:pitrilysin family protein [bacterium]
MKYFKRIVLKNGLRIILAPQPSSLATTVLVLVEAGSKYETKNINGLSHFLEHMCFKGTTKRPQAIDIASELDALGASYNAFTSQEWTGYYAKVETNNADKALDIISDLYLNPTFAAAEIEKEKGVIIEELNMYEDTPQRKVHDLFSTVLYGDQPAGWDIGGRKEVIRKLNRNNFIKYRDKHYVAKATTVVIAGAIDEKSLLPKIKDHFINISSGQKSRKIKTIEIQARPKSLVRFKESDQTHLIIGCRAFNAFDKRRYALDVLSNILGGGMSSRLFQKVREELGAAYYIGSNSELFTDHGYFAAAAGVDHQKIEIVIKAILKEFSALTDKNVPASELRRAKDSLSGRLILGLETSDALAMFYGGQEVMKEKIVTPKEILQKIRLVTPEEVKAVAKYIFQNNKLNLSVIGPYKNSAKIAGLLRL